MTTPPPPPDIADELCVKVVLLGTTNVGKTSLVHYIIYDEPLDPLSNSTTIVAQHSKLNLQAPIRNPKPGQSKLVKFSIDIWDTGGQERFQSTSPIYIRGANVAIIIASTDDKSSINELERFLKLLKDHAPEAHCIFVLNKCDLIPDRDLALRVLEVRETLEGILAEDSTTSISVIPASAHTGVGIQEASETYQAAQDKLYQRALKEYNDAYGHLGDDKPQNTPPPPNPPQTEAIVPQLVQYLLRLSNDGGIMSKQQKKNRDNIINLNQTSGRQQDGKCCQ
jgi:small GTP-binding protein